MIKKLLEMFTTTEKVEAMLAYPIIELIFISLFSLFIVTLVIHFVLFFKIRHVRHYLQTTNRFELEPLKTIKEVFERRQSEKSFKLDTFIQEQFSNWHMFQLPIVSLMKIIHMTISVFILLGVLGTFIGLTLSLGNISANSDELVENVAGVLSGIDVAFYTSIVGMSFSLLITVLIRLFNTEYLLTDLMLKVESSLEQYEKHNIHRMIEVSEDIHIAIRDLEANNQQSLNSIVDAFAGFKDYTEGLQQSAHDLATFNDGLSSNLEDFNGLFIQMKEVTTGFSSHTEQLNNNFNDLFAFFKQIEHRNEQQITTFEQVNENIKEISEHVVHNLEQFDASADDLKQFSERLLDKQDNLLKSFVNIKQKVDQLVHTMGAHNQTFKDIFGNDVTVRLTNISQYISELKQSFDRVAGGISTLPEALEVINQTQREHSHLLGDRFHELKEFNASFSYHLKKHEEEIVNLEKYIRDATSTFDLVASKNSSLLHEMNRIVSTMDQTSSQQGRQFDTHLETFQETLTNHVTSVENVLSRKLDTIVQNLNSGLYSLSENINRELTDMYRLSGEATQESGRVLQQMTQDIGRELQLLNRLISSIGQGQGKRTPIHSIGMNRDEY